VTAHCCIHIIRCIVRDYSQPSSSIGAGSRVKTLELALKLDIQSTLPELQHQFCALWNEIVLSMWNTEDPLIQHASVTVLSHIRHLYLSLHKGTDSSRIAFSASTTSHDEILHRRSSYPLCDVPGHFQPIDSASQIWDVALALQLGGAADASPAPASSFIFPYDDTTPTIVFSTPPDADAPSFPSPSPDYNGVHLSDAPSSAKVPATLQLKPPSLVVKLPHSTLESHFSPAASVGVAVSGTTYGTIDASAIPSTASAVPYGDVRAGPQNEKTATVLPSTVPRPRFSSYLLPTPSRAPPSSSSDSKPQGASAMNSHSFTSLQTLSAHDGSRDENPSILMEAPSRLCQSEPPTPGAATRTLRPESRNSSRESASLFPARSEEAITAAIGTPDHL
jgi:hypothetical protein